MRTYTRWAAAATAVSLLVGAGLAELAAQGVKSDSKVKLTAKADKPADGKQVVTVTLDIEQGWHAYANPVGNNGLATSQTKITVDGAKADDVQIDYPKGKEIQDAVVGNYNVYDGQVEIKVTVKNPPDSLKLKVKFMACDDKGKCLLPATVELTPK
jgi:DsbC/DsbD-like thiol-disulfide interchange protein